MRWLLIVRKTSYICGCGGIYDHLWREALFLAHRQRAALRRYLFQVYARMPDREGRLRGCEVGGCEAEGLAGTRGLTFTMYMRGGSGDCL